MIVRNALRKDLSLLNAIEDAADSIYPTGTYPDEAENCSSEALDAAFNNDLVFVAVEELEVVGFAVCRLLGDCLHLQQLSVLPEHGRKGFGHALIATVIEKAAELGSTDITLTTFRDFPWNAPFYTKIGFTVMPEESLVADIARLLEKERISGLRNRVAMRYQL